MARRKSTVQIGVTGLGKREELADGVFINTHYRGCTPGAIYTEEGIVLVDAPLIPQQAMDWREQIEEEFPGQPFLYMINTDHHRGHALGNQYFLPVTVVAHERAHKEMSGYTENFKDRVRNSFKREPDIQAQFGDIIIVPPDITFTNRAKIIRGSREIDLIFVGGHTPATSLVWLPEEEICFVGDILWVDQHPYMAQGNTLEWLAALELIRDLGAKVLVPGHGPVCEPDATHRVAEYIVFMRGRVRDYYREGKTKNEAKSGLVSEMVEWFPVPPERKAKIESQIKSGINRVYREIQREEEEAATAAETGDDDDNDGDDD
ncbi:MAG: MBL fold metallo-hydrolase [Caldilineaceae bacterium]|nr:MBL fold metallo-hydrolase [Caldilineaceae bacterium]MCB9140087.1 MBL fold metallo-hydrolase [Caldilineaceae bacterium]